MLFSQNRCALPDSVDRPNEIDDILYLQNEWHRAIETIFEMTH
jgi:hypothetical protein